MRSSNTGTCTPTGERYKPYRGIEIDGNLDIDIMDALNAILGIGIVSTCAGHHAAEENATLPCPHVTLVIPHESAPKVIQALRDLPDTVIERTHDWFPARVLTSVVVSATIAGHPREPRRPHRLVAPDRGRSQTDGAAPDQPIRSYGAVPCSADDVEWAVRAMSASPPKTGRPRCTVGLEVACLTAETPVLECGCDCNGANHGRRKDYKRPPTPPRADTVDWRIRAGIIRAPVTAAAAADEQEPQPQESYEQRYEG